MKETEYSTLPKVATAVLVAVSLKSEREEKTKEYLQELDFLASTLEIKVLKHFSQRLDRPDSGTFVGSGKLEEIKTYIEIHDVDWVIFDDELSPSQVKNINNVLKRNIYDRSLLILDIFMKRARTAQARTQVELAKHQYLLPRLTRMWTHLERQRGGTGTRGGAGEKEIETDRRVIKHQISLLKEQLQKIDRTQALQRKSREGIVRVAIVGYTNVGKSTLMNLLTKADVFAENKLFATVDSTVRKVVWDQIPFLLTDTVGFIRKLPHQLIECFKSTLDEVAEADVLLHVIDLSHSGFEEHIDVVNKTLIEIKAHGKPTLLVFNKIDQYNELQEEQNFLKPIDEHISLEQRIEALKKSYLAKESEAVFISAREKENIEDLRMTLLEMIKQKHFTLFPHFLSEQL